MSDIGSTEQNRSVKGQKTVLKFWNWPELLLLGGILSLGIAILLIHLLTWGIPAWRQSRRLVRGECAAEKLYVHNRPDENGQIGYRPEILIRFSANGKEYRLRAYDRLTLTEDEGFYYDRAGAERMAKEFRVGESYPCWFRPDDPTAVIIKKDSVFWGWLFLLIPVSLTVFGLFGLIWQAKKRSVSREKFVKPQSHKERYPTVPTSGEINESPGTDLTYRLPTVFSPVIETAFGVILAILWNGVSWWTFFYVLSVRADRLDLLLAILFGVIFCGTGLASLIWFCWRFQSILHTGTTILEISDHPIVPDRKYRVALRQSGSLFARLYRIDIVCDEIARYRQGTDTLTNQKEVFRLPLFAKSDFLIPRGETFREEFFMKLPLGAMHSLSTESNLIRWKIVVEIKTKKAGTIKRESPIVVLPYSPDLRD